MTVRNLVAQYGELAFRIDGKSYKSKRIPEDILDDIVEDWDIEGSLVVVTTV